MTRFMAAIATVTLGCLLFVHLEVETVKAGYVIRKQEEVKLQALDRARALKYNIASLKAPHNLERRLLAQKITLASPEQWKTLVMPGAGSEIKSSGMNDYPAYSAPFFTKFFVGTARAEAKEN